MHNGMTANEIIGQLMMLFWVVIPAGVALFAVVVLVCHDRARKRMNQNLHWPRQRRRKNVRRK